MGEKSDDTLALGGKRDVAVIYEDGVGGAEDLLRKDEGAGRSGEPGFGAERMEKLKADGFAALPLGGIDVEVRSDDGMDEAVSVDDPERKDGELGVRADQVFTKQRSEPRHHLQRVLRGFAGKGRLRRIVVREFAGEFNIHITEADVSAAQEQSLDFVARTSAKPSLGVFPCIKIFLQIVRGGVRLFAVGLIGEAECRRIEFRKHAKLMPGEDRRTIIVHVG